MDCQNESPVTSIGSPGLSNLDTVELMETESELKVVSDNDTYMLEFKDCVKKDKFTVNIKNWEAFKEDLIKNSANFVQEEKLIEYELFLQEQFSSFEQNILQEDNKNDKSRTEKKLKMYDNLLKELEGSIVINPPVIEDIDTPRSLEDILKKISFLSQ